MQPSPKPKLGAADQPWYPAATNALMAEIDGQHERACVLVEGLLGAFGWQALQSAMQVWADHAMRAVGIAPGTRIKPTWREMTSGEVTAADETPVHARWAGQMLAARAAMDPQQWEALLKAPPAEEMGPYIEAYLSMAATQIRDARGAGGA